MIALIREYLLNSHITTLNTYNKYFVGNITRIIKEKTKQTNNDHVAK